MNNWIFTVFAYFGVMVTAVFVLFFLCSLYQFLKEKIRFLKKKIEDKRRFEGDPTGKCYCLQCDYWHAADSARDTGLCMIWEKWTADAETCSRGTLRTEQGYKDETWRIK